jgi:PKD repeat protein
MMDDDRGGNIPVTTRNGVLEVVRVLGPPSVEENLPPPRDLDGDGLYEDINGNGRLDYDDVVKFFRHFDDSVITQYSRYYDFNRNGRLDYDDIVELFKKV